MSWTGTVTCGHCGYRGHNKRSCNDYKQWLKSRGREDELIRISTRKCGWCKQTGHNVQTCSDKKNSKAKLAELEPLFKSHMAHILRLAGLGKGALISREGAWGDETKRGIVIGARVPHQRFSTPYSGSRVHNLSEPRLIVFWQGENATQEAWLPRGAFSISEPSLKGTLSEVEMSGISSWGYGSTQVLTPSKAPLSVGGTLEVGNGQTVAALEKWIKLLTENAVDVERGSA